MMNQITILTFGVITEITGNRNLLMEGIDSTEKLVEVLEKKYPLLKTVQYAIAVNREVIQQHTHLTGEATVALLPPFSGG